jgi:hypothetical protein
MAVRLEVKGRWELVPRHGLFLLGSHLILQLGKIPSSACSPLCLFLPLTYFLTLSQSWALSKRPQNSPEPGATPHFLAPFLTCLNPSWLRAESTDAPGTTGAELD